MSPSKVFLLLVAGACAAPMHSPASPSDAAPRGYENSIPHARAVVDAYVKATGVPGLQVAVAVDGRIVWSESFGRANIETAERVTAASRFRIASISKLLTGTLTAKLAHEGRLDLDRPLGEYVTGMPEAWRPITARMLVHHTSGIPHYVDAADAIDTMYYASTRDALARFSSRPLRHEPGTAELYSTNAFTVLALAIESAAGRPFLAVMQDEILKPLGMRHTVPDDRRSPTPGRTAFYDLAADGSVTASPFTDLSGRWAGGGFLSTAEDLARFGSAHTRGGRLSEGVRTLVTQRSALPGGSMTREGFAWGPRDDWDGRPMIWGDGSTPGARGGLLVYPDDGLAIAILGNARGLALERGEFQALARVFLAERAGRGPSAVPDDVAGEWMGTVAVGSASVPVKVDLRPANDTARGAAVFTNWRSLSIVDAFQAGDTTWVMALDRQGILPLALRPSGARMSATVPRTGWSFELAR